MFSFARIVVRNKIATVALVGIGAYFLMPSQEEEPASTNPWAAPAETPALAQAGDDGFIDGLVDQASDLMSENGLDTSQISSSSIDNAASAFAGSTE